VLSPVREEVVDEHSDDREEEDEQAPEDFVGYGAVGLEDLDCITLAPALEDECSITVLHTKDDDIQDQDNEAENPTSGAKADVVVALRGDRASRGSGGERELQKQGDEGLEQHLDETDVSCCGGELRMFGER
jgi:hypothetical protein